MAGSFQGQRNIASNVSQVMNIYQGVTNMQQTTRSDAIQNCTADMPIQNKSMANERRNSWFKAENYHLGGNAPSGRNTPEYWGGAWEGSNPWCTEASKGPTRSAATRYARAQKRKDKREVARAKAMGLGTDLQWKCTDAPEKKRMRNDAQILLDILRGHKIEYGKEPEKAVLEGARECARLGSKFLELASTGDRYSVRKYLRAELMKRRKDTNDQTYQCHLAEYEELHKSYCAAWDEAFG